jgi:hypothetical protein
MFELVSKKTLSLDHFGELSESGLGILRLKL